jgi:hypothetical protein
VASYPWSDAQDWALKDNLPTYMFKIPRTLRKGSSSKITMATYALWRSLLQDVPELAGYPADVLQARYQMQQQEAHIKTDSSDTNASEMIGILPFLQDYEFSAQGGVCGTVYGLEGVADGSRIETSAVANVQETLPMGYVQTTDGSALFEMGRPMSSSGTSSETDASWKILSGATAASAQRLALDAAASSEKALVTGGVTDADGYLVRLGAVTGIMLAGATAINMISHHMTVNVFWV